MKNTSFVPLCILIIFWSLCLSIPHLALATNPGIYKTVTELKAGTPSMPLCYNVYEMKIRCGVWGLGKQSVAFSKLCINQRQAHELNKIVAFSDSLNTYVKVNKIRVHKLSRFAKAEAIGNYLYYWDVVYHTNNHGLWWIDPVQKLFNKDTGKRIVLNRCNLRKIIADKPALLDSFKHEKHKGTRLKDYLMEYYRS
jgi:hypothetical protein